MATAALALTALLAAAVSLAIAAALAVGPVLDPIEGTSRGVLFWRQLTQWYGGMGMVVLAVSVLPYLGVGGLAQPDVVLKCIRPQGLLEPCHPECRQPC